jgi:hypothetical protein
MKWMRALVQGIDHLPARLRLMAFMVGFTIISYIGSALIGSGITYSEDHNSTWGMVMFGTLGVLWVLIVLVVCVNVLWAAFQVLFLDRKDDI